MPRNEAGTPQQFVLAEALTQSVGGRRVKTAVFTTFEFEPAFFELHVLACLFADVAWSHMPSVKRAQIGDALRGLEHVAVFYDHRGLRPEGGAARLDYERIAVARPYGVFHAKNILLLVENPPDDKAKMDSPSRSLILMTTSANLTRSGWHENLEIAHVMESEARETCAMRDDLLNQGGLLAVLKRASPGDESQPAVEAVHQFLLNHADSPAYRKHGGRLRPRLYVGREKFADFLQTEGRIQPDEYCLEIISPFFEDTAAAPTLHALLDAVRPKETRIYLPVDDDGKARCSREFFESMQTMKDDRNVHWACLSDDLTRWGRKGDKTRHRNVHAKVYRLFTAGRARSDWRDVQVVGSVNLTGAAHRGGATANFETAVLLDLECAHQPAWWLSPIEKPPADFLPQNSPEYNAGTLACHELTLRFHWNDGGENGRLEYHWKSETPRPQAAHIEANGCHLFTFDAIVFDRWQALDDGACGKIRERLLTSSLVELCVGDKTRQPLLVQEVNMAQKPSLLGQLTAAEILEYWSLLTPDQRNEFLERKLAALLEDAQTQAGLIAARVSAEATESFFDRFAGIFHAFSCLEEHVLEALKRGAEKEARYRLLGTSYDSLPTLADQVTKWPDAVVAYVTLLRASEVFQRLRSHVHREGIRSGLLDDREIRRQCDRYERRWGEACEQLKERLSWEGEPDHARFFAWYEKAFAGSVKPFRPKAAQEAGR